MNREIKFRAKQSRIIQHFPIRYGLIGWVYGWLHCSYDGSFFTMISNINDEKMETETYIVESSTVCELTGLKDKNGKEIYEGDIFGGSGSGDYIAWCEKCKSFQLLASDKTCYSCAGDVFWCDIVEACQKGEIEIIGNIYDNPELLN